jgi:DNA-binding transcriptional ArsR family regulator
MGTAPEIVQRRSRILAVLRDRSPLTVNEVAEKTGIGASTLYNDLRALFLGRVRKVTENQRLVSAQTWEAIANG